RRQPVDMDVGPGHAPSPPGSQCLHDRLLRREPAREELHSQGAVARLGLLALREEALGEAVAVPVERRPDAVDFDEIDAMPDDVHGANLLPIGGLDGTPYGFPATGHICFTTEARRARKNSKSCCLSVFPCFRGL